MHSICEVIELTSEQKAAGLVVFCLKMQM
jgi:hypothetical protein